MATAELTLKALEADVHPDWCPGCGDFGVLKSLKEAIVELKIPPHKVLVVSGIGCSSNLPGFIRAYGVHSLHGRALPVATGAKLANHRLHVVAVGGTATALASASATSFIPRAATWISRTS